MANEVETEQIACDASIGSDRLGHYLHIFTILLLLLLTVIITFIIAIIIAITIAIIIAIIITGHYTSFVHMRGSVPAHWAQDISKIQPKPPIFIETQDPFAETAGKHFNQLLERLDSVRN